MQVHDADVGIATSSAVLVATPPALRTADRAHPGTPSFAVAGSGPMQEGRSPLIPTAAYYAQAFGWPVAMDGEEIALVCGLTVDVLAVPAGLGGEVNGLLCLHSLETPVFEDRDGGAARWMFLCKAREGGHIERSLTHHGVVHLASGSLVRLPLSPACSSGQPRWITRPNKGTTEKLPPWGAVYSLIRRAISR